ncbi:MAG: hypothetical protein R3A13_07700 [Bdellovibrionota bacterium]
MSVFGMVSTRDSLACTELGLDSFFKTTNLEKNDEFFLIDNDQSLGSEQISKFPITLKLNESSLGFAANANQCVAIALERKQDLYFLNNDVIFTENWYQYLQAAPDDMLCTPLSNREIEYVSSVANVRNNEVVSALHCKPPPIEINQYRGNEFHLNSIALAHQRNVYGYHKVIHLPFFCVRIPYKILATVGKFDEAYGQGGGEDFDYCGRCYLAGHQVGFAVSAYMLHFGGQSTYVAESEKDRQQEREAHFRKVFKDKWGSAFHDLLLNEDDSILKREPKLQALFDSIQLKEAIEFMIDGRQIPIRIL